MDRKTYMDKIHAGANDDIRRFLFGDQADTVGIDYVARKEATFRDLIQDVAVVPGAIELLDRARRAGLRLAVVTNAPRENAELLLAPLGGAEAFDAVVLGDELARGKPHPLPYLTALEQLGVGAPNACGFEDSVGGVTALLAAGVFAVGVGKGSYVDDLTRAGAGRVVADLNWDGLSDIDRLRVLRT